MEHNLMMTLCAFGVMAAIIAMVAILESSEDDQDVDDHHKIKWPSYMQMHTLAVEFEALQGFQNVVGTIDGSHIPIIAPHRHHEDNFNRKGFHSIVLQMAVTAKCLVWDYHIGWAGSMHGWNDFNARMHLGR
ncbi:hypothetical protein L7F22_001340 [Adiantum nelumboides]|nr:hypothetical protein [Adiantum nelumboides]